MREVKIGTYIKGDENFNFNFYTDLSAYDKMRFVTSVTETLVGENYNSIVRDLIFDFNIVEIFTDVDTSFVKDEDKPTVNPIIPIEEFLEETNIVDIIVANVRDGLIDELNKAVDENIEFKTGIHKNALNDALASLIGTLEKKVNEIDLTGMMDMVKAFGGMTEEFTPESLVKAYMGTDTFKNNQDELNEVRKKKSEVTDEMANVINIANKK